MHRDVKPQNVLLDPEGLAKVTDFGIARSLRDDGLTADGRVLGTTDYVSPEQALGHDVDGQSDIYSLGVVLYEMLTGDVPFHGENQISVAMKHVREDLPDIQRVRPEVSATTAAVLDRMTDKDLAHRYADVPSLIADLEDALALEAARQGTSTGEATAVIRTLPATARRRLPFRMRHSLPILGVIGLIAVAVVIVLIVFSDEVPKRVERGTGTGRLEQPTPEGTRIVSVRRASAQDYDPLGDEEEHSDEASRVVDRDDGTAWTTESYQDGLEGAGKTGVGLYIDAKPKVAAVELSIETPEPGWRATIYAAPPGPAPKTVPEGWTKVGGGTVNAKDKTLQARHRRRRVPLLPGLDHAAAPRAPPTPRSPRSGCSGSRRLEIREAIFATAAAKPAREDRLEDDGALGLEALEREAEQPVAELRERQARRLPQLRVDARRREARQRVELVDQHARAVLDEEVHARQARAADAQEGVDGQPPDVLAHRRRRAAPGRRAPSRPACTWPRSRTSRRP